MQRIRRRAGLATCSRGSARRRERPGGAPSLTLTLLRDDRADAAQRGPTRSSSGRTSTGSWRTRRTKELIEEFESEAKTRTLTGGWARSSTCYRGGVTLFALYFAIGGRADPADEHRPGPEHPRLRPDDHDTADLRDALPRRRSCCSRSFSTPHIRGSGTASRSSTLSRPPARSRSPPTSAQLRAGHLPGRTAQRRRTSCSASWRWSSCSRRRGARSAGTCR